MYYGNLNFGFLRYCLVGMTCELLVLVHMSIKRDNKELHKAADADQDAVHGVWLSWRGSWQTPMPCVTVLGLAF